MYEVYYECCKMSVKYQLHAKVIDHPKTLLLDFEYCPFCGRYLKEEN